MKLAILPIIAVPMAAISVMALAQQPASDLADLVGGRGAGGEAQLQARGYQHVKTETGGDSKYSYWWNPSSRQCVSVRTNDGRYVAIVATLPADCGQSMAMAPAPNLPPEVMVGSNGEGEVIFKANNCVAYYSAVGARMRALPSCLPGQLAQADNAMAGYRREQGMSGPVADHSPVYRDFSSNKINLVCHGDGERLTYDNRMGYGWDDRLQRYIPQSIPGYGREEYDAFLTIQLEGDKGRIRLPKSMVPPINAGSDHGWWKLKDLTFSRSQIRARYKLNGLNQPRVTINRRTGRIDIVGQRNFRGNCVAIDRGGLRYR